MQKSHLPVQDCKRPRLMQASIGPRTEICGNPSLPLAMVPCLYQKKATDMVSPKMYSSHWWKNLTYLCGPANIPVSSKPV